MSSPANTTPVAPLQLLLIASLLVLGSLAFAGTWVIVAAACHGRAGWMALVAALNAIAWLRMAKARPGAHRAMLAVFATSASIALGDWLVAALPIGAQVNQSPLEAAQRMGPDFGWMLIRLGSTPLDWSLIAVALVIALRLGR